MSLPIESCLPGILQALRQHERVVIQAPPGAGKTTRVPLALMQYASCTSRIIVIQPRRLAVYGAAHQLAALLDETPGQTIGYTTRFDQKRSGACQIELVTEGIFLRMIQQDPELNGISHVIFDEFHERSVANDLALAFALESQSAWREADTPLKILVMSATLDGDTLANWLAAPLVRSDGRAFPVTTHYHPAPLNTRLEAHLSKLIQRALGESTGSVLVFLPGMKEINQVNDLLLHHGLPEHCTVHRLHAALPQAQQQAAIAPPRAGARKIVLTTNVAETSVTIEGIGLVIDSGLERVAHYDERKGMNVLLTEKISQASAEQRRGRAARLGPGNCFRAWSSAEQEKRPAFSTPEMSRADLLPIALELAIWGCQDTNDLKLLTPPKPDALQRARKLLMDMGALQNTGVITAHGQRMAALGLHPRIAHLMLVAEGLMHSESEKSSGSQPTLLQTAIAAAAILSEGDPLRFHGQLPQSDITIRLSLWESDQNHSCGDFHRATWRRIEKLTKQLAKRINHSWSPRFASSPDLALALAQAFPDHIAQARANNKHRYLLANGKGVRLNPEDSLAGTDYLVILDDNGSGKEPTIRLACALTRAQLENAMGERMIKRIAVRWNDNTHAVESLELICFDQLIVRQKTCPPASPETITHCLLEAICAQDLTPLPWQAADRALQRRLQWLHMQCPETWPDSSDAALRERASDWLAPYLAGMSRLSDLKTLKLSTLLLARLGWEKQQLLEQLAPATWTLPTGHQRDIRYDMQLGPVLSARMQELYGLTQHPMLGNTVPLTIEILSPAHRPIQTTQDLPGFWRGSYAEVAKEMRGRYPKHLWPEDPAQAQATTKTKRHQTR